VKFEQKPLTVQTIVKAWQVHSLSRNPDYQRGEAWTLVQKQALIDSLFREYPIPPIFLERKVQKGLFDGQSESFEIIDGQQRILAMDGFFRDEFELLKPNDDKLRLPLSLRSQPNSWGGRRFSQLDSGDRSRLIDTNIDAYLVEDVVNEDEVRDLFIRLQSGTALTRQQIRDAWPGKVGPWIERLAGKLNIRPQYELFQAVDGRGTRDDDDDPKDRYVKHRQTCAQLLCIMFARMKDPRNFPSVEPGTVDAFYHENTDLDLAGPAAKEVEEVLKNTQGITNLLRAKWSGKRKVPKMSFLALAFFFQDMLSNPYFKFDSASASRLAEYAASVSIPHGTRTVSGPAIKNFCETWKNGLPPDIGILLDEKRLFDDAQKEALWKRDGGACKVCEKPVELGDAEGDHFPIPHSLGGRTSLENGRLVHAECHPRGRVGATTAPPAG